MGLLGSGGTASVYLVVDQLKGERVALKVVHPHLASDPSVQRRIRKEIAAASLLHTETALVPWELHELDGLLCLSMPYHRGQTLTEHVASQGALTFEETRDLGIRVARALEQAHRRGLLHRDVTANNVMVDHGRDAMLMDFGLARAESSTTRSTGMLGTTGFAAPEVYAGERADPRTDLYGLGCVLYLAVTGSLPFGTDNAMGTLQKQLAEDHLPVRAARPDTPDDLVTVIETLLKRERDERPASAGEIVEALTTRTPLGHTVQAEPGSHRRAHLPPGPHAVVISEREEDRARRKVLRVEEGKARKTLESEVTKRAQALWTGVLAYMGVHEPEADSPEQLLVRAIADEAHVEAGLLRQSPALLQREFVLVEGVSRDAARRIAADARSAGFRARLGHLTPPLVHVITAVGLVVAFVGAIPFSLIGGPVGLLHLFVTLVLTFIVRAIVMAIYAHREGELPVAYTASLDPWLTRAVEGRFAPMSTERQPTEAPRETAAEPSRNPLLDRVHQRLDGLARAIDEQDLPKIVRSDLRSTASDLRARADELGDDVQRLEAELTEPAEDLSWVEPRLARLRTKERAGEPVDRAELVRLEGLLRTGAANESLRNQLESQLTAATAGLLEIAATATSVRRTLLTESATRDGITGALQKLQREADAAKRARAELARRVQS